VDVDLIFGIPGQGADDIKADFRTAVSCGATQISTYPFIDFTYEHNKRKPVGRRQKRALLDAILDVSNELGFERTSVWTFTPTISRSVALSTRSCSELSNAVVVRTR